ncbi:MAG TPA: hypothetical protein PLO61_05545 [Fimbriimonadaceae bacterium]|nr:hypothetical protein [Fimbriimonadaceae bacterium]HRJ33024.1 hypothetical protein [Fimbriimonadaceae bacterium]
MRRTPVPPGSVGWIVLAAAAIPILIRSAKPLARKIGQGLRKVGEQLEQAVEEVRKDAPVNAEVVVEEPTTTDSDAGSNTREEVPPSAATRTRAPRPRRSTADVKGPRARRKPTAKPPAK